VRLKKFLRIFSTLSSSPHLTIATVNQPINTVFRA
jgi:hypothetical protein